MHRLQGALPNGDGRRAPFLVAHRAGNDLSGVQAAARSGAALVEADVRLFRGRIEVRHLKTIGPLPILWDRWQLANPFAPRLTLEELLRSPSAIELMLDLKGRNPRLATGVLEAVRPHLSGRRVTICARSWSMLEPFVGVRGVALVGSIGSRRQLRALRRRTVMRRLDGISVHARLLDRETVRDLRAWADVVMTWPVATVERARELVSWGVDGVISENLELARALDGKRA